MKLFFSILIILFFNTHLSQDIPLSKKRIKKIFRQNEKGRTHGFKKNELDSFGARMYGKYDNWYGEKESNKRTGFDTIRLYNHRDFKMYRNCEMTVWNLFKSKKVNFYTVRGNMGTVNRKWFKLKIIEEKSTIKFQIIKDKKIIKSYTVINLELKYLSDNKKKPMYILTLIKNNP